MYKAEGIFLHFLVVNATSHFLGTSQYANPNETVYLDALNSDFIFYPNWEAVGATILLEYRPDRQTSRAYVPGDLLFRYKMRMKPHVIDVMRDNYPATSFEWNEMPDAKEFQGIQSYQTFGRNADGTWKQENVPSNRAVFASTRTSNPYSLGKPGGPCKIVQKIEEAPLPVNQKEDLVQDIYKGDELDNEEASQIYEKEVVPFEEGQVFGKLGITNHAQYRMDFRSIPLESVKKALQEFERWFAYRKNNPDKMKAKDRSKLQSLAQGDPVRFDANREGLTIVFTAPRRGKARLISTWWTGKRNPRPPKPGECDKQGAFKMSDPLEKISNELMYASSVLQEKTACGGGDGPCTCGGSCGCGGGGDADEMSQEVEFEWEHEYEFNVDGDVYIFNGTTPEDKEWVDFVKGLKSNEGGKVKKTEGPLKAKSLKTPFGLPPGDRELEEKFNPCLSTKPKSKGRAVLKSEDWFEEEDVLGKKPSPSEGPFSYWD